jgi:hypothetical protein
MHNSMAPAPPTDPINLVRTTSSNADKDSIGRFSNWKDIFMLRASPKHLMRYNKSLPIPVIGEPAAPLPAEAVGWRANQKPPTCLLPLPVAAISLCAGHVRTPVSSHHVLCLSSQATSVKRRWRCWPATLSSPPTQTSSRRAWTSPAATCKAPAPASYLEAVMLRVPLSSSLQEVACLPARTHLVCCLIMITHWLTCNDASLASLRSIP